MDKIMFGPALLVADKNQKIYDLPGFLACGRVGGSVQILPLENLIPLPPGSNLFFLPDRYPIAFNVSSNSYENLNNFYPVAAFIPPGYTQLSTVAYGEKNGARILPLFSYAPVAFYKGVFYVPAARIDLRRNHDLRFLDKGMLERKIQLFKSSPNRLIRHLSGCARVNLCPNAINFFLGKYEAPLPVSSSCNASCLGCISLQPQGSCPATQPRLKFVPTAEEIAEVALLHIKAVPSAVVSFGQGCEGEPLLAAKIIKAAIGLIRKKTLRGTIHMNTNASLTAQVEALCRAGLDSMRVSLNSVRDDYYQRYYSPQGYGFGDVCNSIAVAKRLKKFVFLNYLVMPGFTDREDEFESLVRFIRHSRVDMIQWRNLNYDPWHYFMKMRICHDSKLLGIRTVIDRLKEKFPKLRHGYFNLPKESLQRGNRKR